MITLQKKEEKKQGKETAEVANLEINRVKNIIKKRKEDKDE